METKFFFVKLKTTQKIFIIKYINYVVIAKTINYKMGS
jgi:hypothetical protein